MTEISIKNHFHVYFIYLEYGGISNGKLCIDVPIFSGDGESLNVKIK